MRITEYKELSEMYEKPIRNACNMRVGMTFYTRGEKPEGFCDSAWDTLYPFVKALCEGGGSFYGDWMKDERSAMISCNDGFRPVSFLIKAE